MTTDVPIEHRLDCPGGADVSTFVGRLGDRVARCGACGYVTVLEHAVEPPRLADLRIPGPDHADARQAVRGGRAWPTHRARRRNRRRRHRQQQREREAK